MTRERYDAAPVEKEIAGVVSLNFDWGFFPLRTRQLLFLFRSTRRPPKESVNEATPQRESKGYASNDSVRKANSYNSVHKLYKDQGQIFHLARFDDLSAILENFLRWKKKARYPIKDFDSCFVDTGVLRRHFEESVFLFGMIEGKKYDVLIN